MKLLRTRYTKTYSSLMYDIIDSLNPQINLLPLGKGKTYSNNIYMDNSMHKAPLFYRGYFRSTNPWSSDCNGDSCMTITYINIQVIALNRTTTNYRIDWTWSNYYIQMYVNSKTTPRWEEGGLSLKECLAKTFIFRIKESEEDLQTVYAQEFWLINIRQLN